MTVSSSSRLWLLLAATIAWSWASSVFSPWAVDRAPRLWLYDLLFYLRFVLLAWAAAEVLLLAFRRTWPRLADASPLALLTLVVVLACGYQYTEAGLRWKLAISNDALHDAARVGNSDQRQRAGHFLIDSVRTPCDRSQSWLWLGRPFGGGSGINLALVHAGANAPMTPFPEAFAFWHAGDGWWLAYQHGERYQQAAQRHASQIAACRPGTVLPGHRQGTAFIDGG